MKLTEETKNKIIEILDSDYFKNSLYVDANGNELDKTKRDELGQFYTPGKICIRMIEKFTTESFKGQNILDPTVGSGNLLIACLIAGADIDKLYGNEYDSDVIPTCRKRISEAFKILNGRYPTDQEFRPWQIHQGNALHKFALTYFDEDYEEMYFDGKTQPAARKRKLDDPNYDAYTKSEVFKRKHPDLYKEELHLQLEATQKKQAEQANTYSLW
jgi:hypothetical protein